MSNALETTHGGDIVMYDAPQPVNLFGTDKPEAIIAKATETANALARVVKAKKLTTQISGRDHVRVEGWTLLGTMLGVFPVCLWTRKLEDGWEARVEARTLAGAIVGAAEAQCLRAERLWSTRDDYALRSMAQTRATSKALRQPLGFVMTLAGFEATPYEEMPAEADFAPVVVAASMEKASEKQQKLINLLIGKVTKAGIVDAVELAERFQAKYGTSLVAELSPGQASEVITGLKTIAGEE